VHLGVKRKQLAFLVNPRFSTGIPGDPVNTLTLGCFYLLRPMWVTFYCHFATP